MKRRRQCVWVVVVLAAVWPVGWAQAQALDADALDQGGDAECARMCGDTACGWADDCFCAFCDVDRVCIDGRCREVARFADPHEPDDDPVRAHAVPWPDYPGADREVRGGITAGDPMDWFATTPADGVGTRWTFEATLTGPAQDRDLDLAVCYRCDRGDPADPAGPATTAPVELDAPIPGARCFASMRPWGQDERVVLTPACEPDGRVATVWIAVWPASEHDAETPYRLTILAGPPPGFRRAPQAANVQ